MKVFVLYIVLPSSRLCFVDILDFGAFCGRFGAALNINTENCALLGYYAASSGNCLLTCRDNPSFVTLNGTVVFF